MCSNNMFIFGHNIMVGLLNVGIRCVQMVSFFFATKLWWIYWMWEHDGFVVDNQQDVITIKWAKNHVRWSKIVNFFKDIYVMPLKGHIDQGNLC